MVVVFTETTRGVEAVVWRREADDRAGTESGKDRKETGSSSNVQFTELSVDGVCLSGALTSCCLSLSLRTGSAGGGRLCTPRERRRRRGGRSSTRDSTNGRTSYGRTLSK